MSKTLKILLVILVSIVTAAAFFFPDALAEWGRRTVVSLILVAIAFFWIRRVRSK